MSTNWKVVSGEDLWKVLSRDVVAKANEDSQGGKSETADIDVTGLEDRAEELVNGAIQTVRAAILQGGRTALSATAMSVPPEAERYVWHIAAYELTSSPPSLQQVLIFDGGVYSPRQVLYKEAMGWLERVRNGMQVTAPTDEDEDTTPTGVRWGDINGTSDAATAGKVDMTTDGPWPSA